MSQMPSNWGLTFQVDPGDMRALRELASGVDRSMQSIGGATVKIKQAATEVKKLTEAASKGMENLVSKMEAQVAALSQQIQATRNIASRVSEPVSADSRGTRRSRAAVTASPSDSQGASGGAGNYAAERAAMIETHRLLSSSAKAITAAARRLEAVAESIAQAKAPQAPIQRARSAVASDDDEPAPRRGRGNKNRRMSADRVSYEPDFFVEQQPARPSRMSAGRALSTSTAANAYGNPTGPINERWADAAVRAGLYGSAATALYGGATQVFKGVETVKKFDEAMTGVRRVINPIGSDMARLGNEARSMGREFGTSIVEVAEAMALYAQQGKSMGEVINQTRVAMLAANVTDLSVIESVSSLTAAMAQFNMVQTQSTKVLDSWNEVENLTSINARVLTDSIKGAGITAAQSGIQFDQFLGVTTAVGEATRKSGDAIGTSLKFIFQHMKDPKAIEALQEVGVYTEGLDGTFKNAGSTIAELRQKWDGLTETQRKNAALNIAGTRHANDFLALMDRWDRAIDVTAISLGSQGSAMRENAIAMDSLSKQLGSLSASWQTFWTRLGDAGGLKFLKDVTSTLRTVLDTVNEVTKAVPGGATGAIGIGALGVGAAAHMGMMPNMPDSLSRQFHVGRYSENVKRMATTEWAAMQAAGFAPQQGMSGLQMPAGRPVRQSRMYAQRVPRVTTQQPIGADQDIPPEVYDSILARQPHLANTWGFVGKRQLAGVGMMVGSGIAGDLYNQMSPTKPGEKQGIGSLAANMGTDAIRNIGLMMTLWRSTPNATSAMGSIRGQGMIGGGTQALLGTLLVTSIVKQLAEFRDSKTPERNDQDQLDRLRGSQEKIATATAEVRRALDMIGRGEASKITPQSRADIRDLLVSSVPGFKPGQDVVADLRRSKPMLDEAARMARGTTAGLTASQVAGALKSDEVEKLVQQMSALSTQLKSTNEHERELARTERVQVRQDLSERLLSKLESAGLEAGASRAGLGAIPAQLIERVAAKMEMPSEDVFRTILGRYMQGAVGSDVDLDKFLAGRPASDFYSRGSMQIGGGDVVSVASGRTLATGADVAGFKQRARDSGEPVFSDQSMFRTMASLQPEAITRLISAYNTSVDRLLQYNDRLVKSNDSIVEAMSRASRYSPGATASQVGVKAALGGLDALDRLRTRGSRGMPDAYETKDLQNPNEMLRQMTGNIEIMSEREPGTSLQGQVSNMVSFTKAWKSIREQADRYFKAFVQSGGVANGFDEEGTGYTQSQEFVKSMAGDNAFKLLLNRAMKVGTPQEQAAMSPEDRAGRQQMASGLIAQLQGILGGKTQDSMSRQLEGLGRHLDAYGVKQESVISGFAEDMAQQFQSGQINRPEDYRTPELLDAINRLRAQRDDVGSSLERADATRRQMAAPDSGFDPRLVDEFTQGVDSLRAHFKELDAVVGSGADGLAKFSRILYEGKFGESILANRVSLSEMKAAGGESQGLTGLNAIQFEIGSLRDMLAKAPGTFVDTQLQKKYEDGIFAAMQKAGLQMAAEQQRRQQSDAGLFQKVLTSRLSGAVGLPSNLMEPAINDAMQAVRESVERIAAEASRGIGNKTPQAQDQFINAAAAQLEPIRTAVGRLRELQDTGFQMSYMQASDSERLFADSLKTMMGQGVSAKSVMADPLTRMAVNQSGLAQQVVGRQLPQENAREMLDVSRDIRDRLDGLPQILAELSRKLGVSLTPAGVTPTAPSQIVTGAGTIGVSEAQVRVHQGERILSAAETSALGRMLPGFAGGTMAAAGGKPINERLGGWLASVNDRELEDILQKLIKPHDMGHHDVPAAIKALRDPAFADWVQRTMGTTSLGKPEAGSYGIAFPGDDKWLKLYGRPKPLSASGGFSEWRNVTGLIGVDHPNLPMIHGAAELQGAAKPHFAHVIEGVDTAKNIAQRKIYRLGIDAAEDYDFRPTPNMKIPPWIHKGESPEVLSRAAKMAETISEAHFSLLQDLGLEVDDINSRNIGFRNQGKHKGALGFFDIGVANLGTRHSKQLPELIRMGAMRSSLSAGGEQIFLDDQMLDLIDKTGAAHATWQGKVADATGAKLSTDTKAIKRSEASYRKWVEKVSDRFKKLYPRQASASGEFIGQLEQSGFNPQPAPSTPFENTFGPMSGRIDELSKKFQGRLGVQSNMLGHAMLDPITDNSFRANFALHDTVLGLGKGLQHDMGMSKAESAFLLGGTSRGPLQSETSQAEAFIDLEMEGGKVRSQGGKVVLGRTTAKPKWGRSLLNPLWFRNNIKGSGFHEVIHRSGFGGMPQFMENRLPQGTLSANSASRLTAATGTLNKAYLGMLKKNWSNPNLQMAMADALVAESMRMPSGGTMPGEHLVGFGTKEWMSGAQGGWTLDEIMARWAEVGGAKQMPPEFLAMMKARTQGQMQLESGLQKGLSPEDFATQIEAYRRGVAKSITDSGVTPVTPSDSNGPNRFSMQEMMDALRGVTPHSNTYQMRGREVGRSVSGWMKRSLPNWTGKDSAAQARNLAQPSRQFPSVPAGSSPQASSASGRQVLSADRPSPYRVASSSRRSRSTPPEPINLRSHGLRGVKRSPWYAGEDTAYKLRGLPDLLLDPNEQIVRTMLKAQSASKEWMSFGEISHLLGVSDDMTSLAIDQAKKTGWLRESDGKYALSTRHGEIGAMPRASKPYPLQSRTTVYVDPKAAETLGGHFQSEGSNRPFIHIDKPTRNSPGTIQTVTVSSDGIVGSWKNGEFPYEMSPRKGLVPVEIWDGGAKASFGSPIESTGPTPRTNGPKPFPVVETRGDQIWYRPASGMTGADAKSAGGGIRAQLGRHQATNANAGWEGTPAEMYGPMSDLPEFRNASNSMEMHGPWGQATKVGLRASPERTRLQKLNVLARRNLVRPGFEKFGSAIDSISNRLSGLKRLPGVGQGLGIGMMGAAIFGQPFAEKLGIDEKMWHRTLGAGGQLMAFNAMAKHGVGFLPITPIQTAARGIETGAIAGRAAYAKYMGRAVQASEVLGSGGASATTSLAAKTLTRVASGAAWTGRAASMANKVLGKSMMALSIPDMVGLGMNIHGFEIEKAASMAGWGMKKMGFESSGESIQKLGKEARLGLDESADRVMSTIGMPMRLVGKVASMAAGYTIGDKEGSIGQMLGANRNAFSDSWKQASEYKEIGERFVARYKGQEGRSDSDEMSMLGRIGTSVELMSMVPLGFAGYAPPESMNLFLQAEAMDSWYANRKQFSDLLQRPLLTFVLPAALPRYIKALEGADSGKAGNHVTIDRRIQDLDSQLSTLWSTGDPTISDSFADTKLDPSRSPAGMIPKLDAMLQRKDPTLTSGASKQRDTLYRRYLDMAKQKADLQHRRNQKATGFGSQDSLMEFGEGLKSLATGDEFKILMRNSAFAAFLQLRDSLQGGDNSLKSLHDKLEEPGLGEAMANAASERLPSYATVTDLINLSQWRNLSSEEILAMDTASRRGPQDNSGSSPGVWDTTVAMSKGAFKWAYGVKDPSNAIGNKWAQQTSISNLTQQTKEWQASKVGINDEDLAEVVKSVQSQLSDSDYFSRLNSTVRAYPKSDDQAYRDSVSSLQKRMTESLDGVTRTQAIGSPDAADLMGRLGQLNEMVSVRPGSYRDQIDVAKRSGVVLLGQLQNVADDWSRLSDHSRSALKMTLPRAGDRDREKITPEMLIGVDPLPSYAPLDTLFDQINRAMGRIQEDYPRVKDAETNMGAAKRLREKTKSRESQTTLTSKLVSVPLGGYDEDGNPRGGVVSRPIVQMPGSDRWVGGQSARDVQMAVKNTNDKARKNARRGLDIVDWVGANTAPGQTKYEDQFWNTVARRSLGFAGAAEQWADLTDEINVTSTAAETLDQQTPAGEYAATGGAQQKIAKLLLERSKLENENPWGMQAYEKLYELRNRLADSAKAQEPEPKMDNSLAADFINRLREKVPGFATGTLRSGRKDLLDASGRIKSDDTLVRLHAGEAVARSDEAVVPKEQANRRVQFDPMKDSFGRTIDITRDSERPGPDYSRGVRQFGYDPTKDSFGRSVPLPTPDPVIPVADRDAASREYVQRVMEKIETERYIRTQQTDELEPVDAAFANAFSGGKAGWQKRREANLYRTRGSMTKAAGDRRLLHRPGGGMRPQEDMTPRSTELALGMPREMVGKSAPTTPPSGAPESFIAYSTGNSVSQGASKAGSDSMSELVAAFKDASKKNEEIFSGFKADAAAFMEKFQIPSTVTHTHTGQVALTMDNTVQSLLQQLIAQLSNQQGNKAASAGGQFGSVIPKWIGQVPGPGN